ncbi:MAG TPA: hypothetical protein VF524_00975 [Polyangia bacterium]
MKSIVSTLALAAALIVPAAGGNLARAEKQPLNACGCRGDGTTCTCERKAKCGCPGECEPKGCEAARQKEMEKEIAAETKKAKDQEQARAKANEPKGEDDEAAGADKAGKASKGPAVKPMTTAAKKQFLKLHEAYLAEHPEAQNKMLSEVHAELK